MLERQGKAHRAIAAAQIQHAALPIRQAADQQVGALVYPILREDAVVCG